MRRFISRTSLLAAKNSFFLRTIDRAVSHFTVCISGELVKFWGVPPVVLSRKHIDFDTIDKGPYNHGKA